jgi:hypothetical protein
MCGLELCGSENGERRAFVCKVLKLMWLGASQEGVARSFSRGSTSFSLI